jgi:hypothetical protein
MKMTHAKNNAHHTIITDKTALSHALQSPDNFTLHLPCFIQKPQPSSSSHYECVQAQRHTHAFFLAATSNERESDTALWEQFSFMVRHFLYRKLANWHVNI